MPTEDPPRSERAFAIWLGRRDLVRLDDDTFLLPVTLEGCRKEGDHDMTLSVDDAARLHAQLSRHLTSHWALTEAEKASRQSGEIYPLDGSGHPVMKEKP